ncbi:MAG: uracil-DNA glycosylase [Gemmatimonadetes bacterium]|nr:uracil-DNA glycosylase [Gemmatimonadota bacterium]
MSVDDALKVLASGATRAAPPAPVRSSGDGPPARGAPAELPRASRTEGVTEDWKSIVGAPDGSEADKPKAPKAAKRPKADEPGAPVVIPPELAAAASLADVAKAIAACKACSLSATAINHVPGEGNPNAKFVVVGEAPGATEDELGRPFVGKSGDLLTKILEAIQLKREDVFICNVLKHRPPGNRNPTDPEIAACAPFLLRQLEILQPKVILALGTFAAQTLLKSDSTIGQLRGIEHTYHGIPLVATYHPAALLRNPNWKRPAWEDVQLARRILDRA